MHPFITEMLVIARQQDMERSLRTSGRVGFVRRHSTLRRHAAR